MRVEPFYQHCERRVYMFNTKKLKTWRDWLFTRRALLLLVAVMIHLKKPRNPDAKVINAKLHTRYVRPRYSHR